MNSSLNVNNVKEKNPLLSPLKMGALSLRNRIVMSPLTRCRADENHVPTDLMAEYYGQRATAGLIIAEATMVLPANSAFNGREPGIYSTAQVEAWKKVTSEVHKKGGAIFLQLWHGGRACHSYFNRGAKPVSASALAIVDDQMHTPEGKLNYEVPRPLTDSEIPSIIEGFKVAAENAKSAGFDGVEIHGANGYLIDQFLRDGSNKRVGPYGGSIENRSRLLLEIVDAVSKIYSSDRVGVRISPLNSFNSMVDSNPLALTSYVVKELNDRHLGFIDLMRADFFQVQKGDVISIARKIFKNGKLLGNMGYTPAEASSAVADGILDGVVFGHHYISNPDLVSKVERGINFVEPDSSTFYSFGAKGYTDYPLS